jgi:uncharacterized protein (UPF0335 family)
MPLENITDEMVNAAIEAGVLEDALAGNVEAIKAIEDIARKATIEEDFKDIANAAAEMGDDLKTAFDTIEGGAKGFAERLNAAIRTVDLG